MDPTKEKKTKKEKQRKKHFLGEKSSRFEISFLVSVLNQNLDLE